MPLNPSTLKGLIIDELEGQGFDTANEHSWTVKLATAIANAVVNHIVKDAQVITESGAPFNEHKGRVQ